MGSCHSKDIGGKEKKGETTQNRLGRLMAA
jgi:hypothetical protein